MNKLKNILIVDDEEFIRLNLKRIFQEENYNVILKSDGKSALSAVNEKQVDIVFLDLNLPDTSGLEVLKNIKKKHPNLLVIIITGFASVESAVDAIKLGAYDYIKKPFKADAIKLIARLAFETLALRNTVKQLKEKQKLTTSLDSILGESPEIIQVKHKILEYAKYEAETVLITGESGVGKELIASAIYSLSPRTEKEFVEINCASIPDNLLESELFGYEKGAFTDAKEKKIGLLEKANGGTLLLDEIGEMAPSLQAKLLRVIEHKKFRRLGSTKDITVDVRILAATNKNLYDAISKKEFREDLYYRLNVLRIDVPALRERGNDIILLAKYFLELFNKKFNKNLKDLNEEAQKIFLNYNWPGNVRELKNMIERMCILQDDSTIQAHHLEGELFKLTTFSDLRDIAEKEYDISNSSFKEIINQTEINLIKQAFILSGKNITKAAQILNIPRETLRYKIDKHKIDLGE